MSQHTCALPLEAVIETMRPLPIEAMKGAPPAVLGMAIVRGAPVPVVDGRRLFGASGHAALRWVTVRAGPRVVALAVDDVIGVRTIDRAALAELPPLVRDAADGAVQAIGAADAELMLLLETARLVPDELVGGPG